MKKIIFFSLLILICLFPAVSAGNFTNADTWISGDHNTETQFKDQTDIIFDLSSQDKAISLIILDNIIPGEISFTLTMGSGEQYEGYIHYSRELLTASFDIGLGSQSHNWSSLENFLTKAYISTYATNQDTGQDGILLYESWFTNLNNLENYCFQPDPYISSFPITKIEIHSDNPITATIAYADISYVQKDIEEGTGSTSYLKWLSDLINFVSRIFTVIPTILYVFYFIFIKHFFEIIVLYEIVLVSYTAYNSRDMVSFFKKFIDYNTKFVDFWIGFVNKILDIFYKIIQSLKLW
jgi:hypothetical protein